MLIRSHLFMEGHWNLPGHALDTVLRGHERDIIESIRRVSALDELTDQFLADLVKGSLVSPLVLHFDKATRKTRTEDVDVQMLPNFYFMPDGQTTLPRTVARISVPFSGDPGLFKHAPNEPKSKFPCAEVTRRAVEFDIVLPGTADDQKLAADSIKSTRDDLEFFVERVNKQVKTFNESIPSKVETEFKKKLETLTGQHSIFDQLGIPEAPESPDVPMTGSSPPRSPRRSQPRSVQIIQIVQNQYVEQLNQINNNVGGDVNNAIQSAE